MSCTVHAHALLRDLPHPRGGRCVAQHLHYFCDRLKRAWLYNKYDSKHFTKQINRFFSAILINTHYYEPKTV